MKKYNTKPIAVLKLDSQDASKLNEITQRIYNQSKTMGFRLKGPVSLPTKKLKLDIRRSPCGRGSSTFVKLNKKISSKLFEIYNQRLLNHFISSLETIPGVNMHLQISQ